MKNLSELISETELGIVEVLNKSQLAPEILELILKNMVSSVHDAIKAQPTDLGKQEETKEE